MTQERWGRYPPPYYAHTGYAGPADWSWKPFYGYLNYALAGPERSQHPGNKADGPGEITADSRGFGPLPSHGFPNMLIDPCPAFAPNTSQDWKREGELWFARIPGAISAQVLAKLIHALPLPLKTDALLYMESAEKEPEARSVDHIMRLMGTRYGRTDSERVCVWLTSFTEFERERNENYKDFRARFSRCSSKLAALDMPMTQQVIFNQEIQALRLPEVQLPIALSSLESKPGRFSVDTLLEMTTHMYETHRPKIDTDEVFAAETTHRSGDCDRDEPNACYMAKDTGDNDSRGDIMSVTLGNGAVFLTKPKKPQNREMYLV